ncbi:MAG: hypothetical protein ACXVAX_08005 [Pseudobdellovibrio sp.]
MGKIILNIFLIFFSVAALAVEPQQLNTEGFASCLAQDLPEINYFSAIARNLLYPGDMVLPYLAVYAGKRLPVVGGLVQYRWSGDYASEEQTLARRLYERATGTAALLPNVIYQEALNSCGSENAFCAALISHNVLRTLGRSETAIRINPITQQKSDLNPEWFKIDRSGWLARAQKIQQSLISFHRDGSDDRWGDNYHFFGLLTFSIHEKSLYRNITSAWIVARVNQVLNPVLAGGEENPGKARIDRDSIEVASRYFDKSFRSGVWNCNSATAYRLAP